MVDGETYFQVNGYRQPRNIGFYAEQCTGQRWRMLRHHEQDYVKSHCLDVFSLHGWCKAFVTENGSIDAFYCSRQYRPMHKESIDVNYQVVEVSLGQTLLRQNIKKEPSNGVGNEEYMRWQGISYQSCNDTNSPNGTFLCSADSSFLYYLLRNKN